MKSYIHRWLGGCFWLMPVAMMLFIDVLVEGLLYSRVVVMCGMLLMMYIYGSVDISKLYCYEVLDVL